MTFHGVFMAFREKQCSGRSGSVVLESAATRTVFLCPEEEGTVRGAPHGAVSPLVISQDQKDPGECFACDCAHPLANSGAANTGDTGAPEGDLPQREKHPPTTLERIFVWRNDVPPHLREVIRDHESLFRRGRAGMTTPPSVVDGCAEPSVDGMAPRESGVIAWRHRFRRRRARLAPSSRPILLWPWVTSPIKRSFTVANSKQKEKQNKKRNKRETRWEVSLTKT